jgi:hypothetical protein
MVRNPRTTKAKYVIGDEVSNWLMRAVGLAILVFFAVTDRDISSGWLGVFGILFGVASIVTLRGREKDVDSD